MFYYNASIEIVKKLIKFIIYLEVHESMRKRKWDKEEIEEYRKIHGSIFYYNKEDSNFLVPKAFGIGWTFNWANPISWLLVIGIIAVIVLRKNRLL